METIARLLAPLAERVLLARRQARGEDPTAAARSGLKLWGVIGHSRALARVLEQAYMVAALDLTLLLTGESGTGKSQFARIVHENSPRAGRPFVELNCAALPETLVESELFGALQGAHSTATRAIVGKVPAAEGGTLLLDEVGDLPLAAQGKLLHLLQTREYFPLGSAKPHRADVRILAATNCDLARAVAERRFREDLFCRLEAMPIRLPTLAERRGDVAELARYFAGEACTRHKLGAIDLGPASVRALETASWPGNIRQLAHVVDAGVVRAATERRAEAEPRHLFPEADSRAPEGLTGALPAGVFDSGASFHEETRTFQTELLRRTLKSTGGNVTQAARRLKMARSHMHRLIRAFGVETGRDE